jgi:hypothetical protein
MSSKFMWQDLVLKNVNVVKREGKQDLTFVDLVDPNTYESSGEYLYLPTDRNERLPMAGTHVDVHTKPSMYNGRASISFASIKPSQVPSASKVG